MNTSTKVVSSLFLTAGALSSIGYGVFYRNSVDAAPALVNDASPSELLEESGSSSMAWNVLAQKDREKYGTGTLGRKYGKYLLAVDGTNDLYWDYVFNSAYKDAEEVSSEEEEPKPKRHEKFAELKSAIGAGKNLKEVCSKSYEEKIDEISKTEDYENDIWRFCSFSGAKIVPLGNDSSSKYGSGTLGEKLKDKLIDASVDKNKVLWEKLGYMFFDEKSEASKLTTTSEFKKMFDSFKNENYEDQLRKKCDLAYKSKTDDGKNEYPESEVLKFCGLDLFE